jgi:hypothetical protein
LFTNSIAHSQIAKVIGYRDGGTSNI